MPKPTKLDLLRHDIERAAHDLYYEDVFDYLVEKCVEYDRLRRESEEAERDAADRTREEAARLTNAERIELYELWRYVGYTRAGALDRVLKERGNG